MHICLISWDYPDSSRAVFPFVKQLVDEFVLLGNKVCVIAPCKISTKQHNLNGFEMVNEWLTIMRPGYISLSNFKIFGLSLTDYFHKRAVNRALRRMNFKPDVIYGHFWKSAYEAYDFSSINKIPLFVASGESAIDDLFPVCYRKKDFIEYVKGVICVSTKNKIESIERGLTSENKCKVYPNAVNTSLFHLIDRNECRKDLGLPLNAFVVCFVGGMIDRKGPLRVSKAIKQLTGRTVYSLFIGKGDQIPDCDNVLYRGIVPHEHIPYYLNAADVFVLPTLHEGCCNAIVEAMSCGLPIISSNRPFNWDVLDESNSIMVDPMNVDEIAKAIQELRDDEVKRNRLSKGAREKSKDLTIEKRAQSILAFIRSRI